VTEQPLSDHVHHVHLAPCRCGGAGELVSAPSFDPAGAIWAYYVRCADCGTMTGIYPGAERAAAEWKLAQASWIKRVAMELWRRIRAWRRR